MALKCYLHNVYAINYSFSTLLRQKFPGKQKITNFCQKIFHFSPSLQSVCLYILYTADPLVCRLTIAHTASWNFAQQNQVTMDYLPHNILDLSLISISLHSSSLLIFVSLPGRPAFSVSSELPSQPVFKKKLRWHLRQ